MEEDNRFANKIEEEMEIPLEESDVRVKFHQARKAQDAEWGGRMLSI